MRCTEDKHPHDAEQLTANAAPQFNSKEAAPMAARQNSTPKDESTTSRSARKRQDHEPEQRETERLSVAGLDADVVGSARGFIARVNMEGPIEGIDSMTSLVNKAIARYMGQLERKHNNGEPFPAPHRLPSGRRSRR